MTKYDERDINDLTIAVFEAINGALKNMLDAGVLYEGDVDDFFAEFEGCFTELLTGRSMGISTGSKAAGMELTLDNLLVPGFTCLKQLLEQINNG